MLMAPNFIVDERTLICYAGDVQRAERCLRQAFSTAQVVFVAPCRAWTIPKLRPKIVPINS
jgi:hypothetical protein